MQMRHWQIKHMARREVAAKCLKCHSERSEESRIAFGSIAQVQTEMFRFAQHDIVIW